MKYTWSSDPGLPGLPFRHAIGRILLPIHYPRPSWFVVDPIATLHIHSIIIRIHDKWDNKCIRSRFVDLTKEIWTPKLRWLEEQSRHRYIPNGTEDQVGFLVPQSKHTYRLSASGLDWPQERGMHTLLAGFAFNFSKIFCDWLFVAELMLQRRNWKSRLSPYERKSLAPKMKDKLLSRKRQICVEKLLKPSINFTSWWLHNPYGFAAWHPEPRHSRNLLWPCTRPKLQATASHDECQICTPEFLSTILQRWSLL